MPVPDAETSEGRLLLAILDGPMHIRSDGVLAPKRTPWSCALTILMAEADRVGLIAAAAALDRLEAIGMDGQPRPGALVHRWEVPGCPPVRVPGKDRSKDEPGRQDAILVTLTPYAASLLGVDALHREIVEAEDEDPRAIRWGWPGEQPRHFELPEAWRMLSLDDPRLKSIRDSLVDDTARRFEIVEDEETGKPIVLFAGPEGIGGVTIVRDHRVKPGRQAPRRPERAAKAAGERRVG